MSLATHPVKPCPLNRGGREIAFGRGRIRCRGRVRCLGRDGFLVLLELLVTAVGVTHCPAESIVEPAGQVAGVVHVPAEVMVPPEGQVDEVVVLVHVPAELIV